MNIIKYQHYHFSSEDPTVFYCAFVEALIERSNVLFCKLIEIYVPPELRNCGLGKAFLEIVEILAQRAGCRIIEGEFCPHPDSNMLDVIDFYTNNGYSFRSEEVDGGQITFVYKKLEA